MAKQKIESDDVEDSTPMPDNGKYKGIKMIDIPASHLIWLYDNNKCSAKVREYIKENYYVLEQQAKWK